ncbi:hypothetical protein LguiA_015112 [Lonicera macranthoides]
MKKTPYSFSFLSLLLLSLNFYSISAHIRENFLQCLTHYSQNQSNSISKVIYTPNNPSYGSILQFSIQNLRFGSPSTPRPDVIVTPVNESQIQEVIYCAKKHGMQIRTRSGGHDFEGLSWVSEVPFVMIDLSNLRWVDVDVESRTAWVQAGVNLGELYYGIAKKSRTLGFPAGVWSTIAVGGHISGGGYGAMKRKYGLAADNVIDARLIDVNGRILDRNSMGEDLFWAIRGGGGASFGVILAWKLNLVDVPETLTVFAVNKTLEQNATKLVHRWQYIAHEFPKDLYIRVQIRSLNLSSPGAKVKRTIWVEFVCLFLGRADKLIPLMEKRFPELGVVKEDYKEMSWIESAVFFAGFRNRESPEILLDRSATVKSYFKAKSDYVNQPISEKGLEGLWEMFYEVEPEVANIYMSPYGGRMSEIPDHAIPFPHRAGNLYMMFQGVSWVGENTTLVQSRINWIRRLSSYLAPYVSKYPRAAYVNYNDLDLGVNDIELNTRNYEQAYAWGHRYFKNNFARLVQVKGMVDPSNFFKHEQSIPLSLWSDM